MKPLAIDLFCGLGGWTEGLLAEGYRVVGFDCERHDYGSGGYPAQLVLEDVQQLHGKQFRDAALIVASPPCQQYSYMAMPWSRAKAIAAEIREDVRRQLALNCLFNTCFRIQHEASVAAGRQVPMVVENVKGAQPWVGRAQAHCSFYLWGDIRSIGNAIVAPNPAFGEVLRPKRAGKRNPDGTDHPQGSWFAIADSKERGAQGEKVPGFNFHQHENGGPGGSFQSAAVAAQNPDGRKIEGTKGNGGGWYGDYAEQKASGRGASTRQTSSKSDSRKAASAQIAKIPLPLSRHIAAVYYPL